MKFRFGADGISEVASVLSDALRRNGVGGDAELMVHLDDDDFRKADEDLFYRNRPGEKYVPSDSEICVRIGTLTVRIMKGNDIPVD